MVGISLVLLGSPHVPRAYMMYMWVHRTCGEPNEIELAATPESLNERTRPLPRYEGSGLARHAHLVARETKQTKIGGERKGQRWCG